MARDSEDGLTKLSRSPAIRKWLGGLLSALLLWLVAWAKGWEEGIARAPDLELLQKRVAKLEAFAADAGLSLQVLDGESAATRKLVDEESLGAHQMNIDVHRDLVMTTAPAAQVKAALKTFDRLIGEGVKPHLAMDIALGLSRPPGR
jgi:hypothetical protein